MLHGPMPEDSVTTGGRGQRAGVSRVLMIAVVGVTAFSAQNLIVPRPQAPPLTTPEGYQLYLNSCAKCSLGGDSRRQIVGPVTPGLRFSSASHGLIGTRQAFP